MSNCQKSTGITGKQLILICVVAMILGMVGTYLVFMQMPKGEETLAHAEEPAIPAAPVNAETAAPVNTETAVPGNAEQVPAGAPEAAEPPKAEAVPETAKLLDQHEPTDFERAFPDLPKKPVRANASGPLDKDYEKGRYGELVHVAEFPYIHKHILMDINSMPIVEIDDVLKQGSSEQMYAYILEKLQNNSCKTNAEDFVIASNENLLMFQTKLEQIGYKKLFDVMYDKHLNAKNCKGNKKFTAWGSVDMTTSDKDPETGEKIPSRGLMCDNGNFKDYDHMQDISLFTHIRLIDGKLAFKNVTLTWSHFFSHYKYLEGYDMDPNMLIAIDGKVTRGENLLYNLAGTLPLGTSTEEKRDDLVEAIFKGKVFHIVYGRYIPDDGRLYLVLSFRTYSLSDMRKACPAMNKYPFSTPYTLPDNLRAIISPFTSKDDPRIKANRPEPEFNIEEMLPF